MFLLLHRALRQSQDIFGNWILFEGNKPEMQKRVVFLAHQIKDFVQDQPWNHEMVVEA